MLVVNSCVLSHHSCIPLSHFLVMVRVIIFFVVISIITILAVFPVRGVRGGIVGVVVGSVLSLKEWSPVSVLDVKAHGIAVCKAMHTIDYALWKR